jgi:DNA (cytosine-5)-methyltransferase 1
MRFGSICSGIEAASVAWHPLGWRAAFLSEIEPFPRAVLASHYPTVPLHGDFTTIKAGEYDAIDLLVGGTPCQSFSVAGLRAGLDDKRGNLALEFCKLARRLRPRWIVWENVPGVLSLDGGQPFASILGGLAECGYGLAYRVLDAQFVRVDGYARAVPQRRRRVFVVGYLGDWRRAAAVLFERESLSGHPAPRREAGQGTAPTLAARTRGGGGLGTDFDLDGGQTAVPLNDLGGASHALTARHSATGRYDPNGETWIGFSSKDHGGDAMENLSPTLRAMGHDGSHANAGGQIAVAHTLKGGGFDASEDGTGRGVPIVPIAFDTTQITSADNRCNPQPGDPCHPIPAHGHAPAVAFNARQDPDVFNGHTGPLDTDGSTQAVQQGWRVRRLMPVECERLQGFPDGYTATTYRGKPAADGPRYKALGNSMAVNVMRWIGQRIAILEAEGLTP